LAVSWSTATWSAAFGRCPRAALKASKRDGWRPSSSPGAPPRVSRLRAVVSSAASVVIEPEAVATPDTVRTLASVAAFSVAACEPLPRPSVSFSVITTDLLW
jgi:hypothetical protein